MFTSPPLPHGHGMGRTGTRFASLPDILAKELRVIKYEVSSGGVYLLVLGTENSTASSPAWSPRTARGIYSLFPHLNVNPFIREVFMFRPTEGSFGQVGNFVGSVLLGPRWG